MPPKRITMLLGGMSIPPRGMSMPPRVIDMLPKVVNMLPKGDEHAF